MKECQRNCHYGNWHCFVPCCQECGKVYTDLSDMKVEPIEEQLKLLNEVRAEWNAGKGMTLDEEKKRKRDLSITKEIERLSQLLLDIRS